MIYAGRVHGPPHAVLVIPHVAVGHRYRFNVGVDERLVPRHRVGNAVDVVPPACVESDEMPAERGAYLHKLERGFQLFDEHVHLYRSERDAQVVLQRRQELVPERGLFGRLYLREIEHDRRARFIELLIVVHYVKHDVDDGSREHESVLVPYVPVVEMKTPRPEYLRREVELLSPVHDYFAAEKSLGPFVHLSRDLLGDVHEHRVFPYREFQIPLVVERHGGYLSERVFAVEHPAVCARQQGMRDVADALRDRAVRLRRRARALDPLTFEIVWNGAALEAPGAYISDAQRRSGNEGIGIEKPDTPAFTRTFGAAGKPGGHDFLAAPFKRAKRFQCAERICCQDVGVIRADAVVDQQPCHYFRPSGRRRLRAPS